MSEQLPIIDWNQHAQVGDDSQSMSRELLALFIGQLPELQAKLEQGFAAQDKEALLATLHRLQGACAYCGLPRLRSAATGTHQFIKQHSELSSEQYEQLTREISLVQDELAKHGIVATA